MSRPALVALDLFAGTGWGVACRRLGIIEHGVENMPAALATREANGMHTAYEDVWDGLANPTIVPGHNVQIASPPCQSFSMAGAGAGRRALDDVLRLLEEGVYKRPTELRDLTRAADFDDKTALVLTPLAYAYQWRPTFIAWEQVPAVLPVWEAAARELRTIGYSVAVAVLNAEQYGVPQTRRRAILVARNDGQKARLPTPTHSRFYSHKPEKLDPGVHRWVTMAKALGWGMNGRPYPTLSTGAGTAGGGTDPAALGGSGARRTVYRERSEGRWEESGIPDNDDPDGILRLTADEAAALQTYPAPLAPGVVRVRTSMGTPKVDGRNGTHELDPAIRPMHTLTGKSGTVNITTPDGSRKLTIEEAAALQTYRDEPPFEWRGTKTEQFLQIGNAVPPLLAEHVLAAITADEAPAPLELANDAPPSADDELPIFELLEEVTQG